MNNACRWPPPSRIRPLPECPRLPPCECPPPCPPPPCPPLCPPPCRPRNAPQAICCGRETERCMRTRICVSGLPSDLCMPLTLVSVEALPERATVTARNRCDCFSPSMAEINVPLTACVRDARGRMFRGCAQVVLPVRLSRQCADPQGCLLASVDLRLIDAACAVCGTEFEVRVAFQAEVYMVRMEHCGRSDCSPFFGRPFYPQPYYGAF